MIRDAQEKFKGRDALTRVPGVFTFSSCIPHATVLGNSGEEDLLPSWIVRFDFSYPTVYPVSRFTQHMVRLTFPGGEEFE